MKKIILLLTLFILGGLKQVNACSCEKPPFRTSLYYRYDHNTMLPFSSLYVFQAISGGYFYSQSYDSSKIVVLQQYQGLLTLDHVITHRPFNHVCSGDPLPAGDTIIAWMSRANADNSGANIFTGYFYTDYCEQHYMKVKNGMVTGWGSIPFPLENFPDTLAAFNLNPNPSTTSVKEVGYDDQLSLFPNPAGDMVQLIAPGINLKEIKLYDLQGKQILHQASARNNNTLYIRDISPGIYLVIATGKDGLVYRKKLLKH